MSIYQTLFNVTIVKCLVTTKINVVDTLYAVTAVSPNIVHHLACVTNQPNVSTALVITLQTQNNAHNGRKKKILKIKCENNLSFPDALKQYEQFYTGQTLESPYHLVAVSGAHFTQGTILIVIIVSSGSAKSRTHQSAVGGFLVTRRGWPGRLRACRIWTFINSV